MPDIFILKFRQIFLTILVTEVILTMWQFINNNFKRRA